MENQARSDQLNKPILKVNFMAKSGAACILEHKAQPNYNFSDDKELFFHPLVGNVIF